MVLIPTSILPRNIPTSRRANGAIQVSSRLIRAASVVPSEVFSELRTGTEGLTEEEAQRRSEKCGPNVVAHEHRFTRLRLFVRACLNPLVILLLVLAIISFATAESASDVLSGVLMIIMVVLGVSLRFVQEARADAAVAKLKAMIHVTATVIRESKEQEVPLAELVPGDVVKLAAGDMIPADIRILSCKDLFLTQASLTGESFPVGFVPLPILYWPLLLITLLLYVALTQGAKMWLVRKLWI